MTNPTLGRHLGRWAEVYFTTPAEQREQAVLELLHSLEEEDRENPEAIPLEHHSLSPAEADTTTHIEALEAAVRQFDSSPSTYVEEVSSDVCPVCQHLNLPDQWYCGMCGYRLKGPAESKIAHQQIPVDMGESREPAAEREVERPQVLPSFAVEPMRELETEMVREIDRTPVWPLHVEDDESRGSRAKIIALVALLAVAAGLFVYQRRTTNTVPPPAVSSASTPSVPTPAAEAPPTVATQQPSPASQDARQRPQNAAAVPDKSAAETPAGPDASVSEPTAVQNATLKSAPLQESGNEELYKARDLLTGPVPDPGQASVWLWKSVSKNNVPAVLLLADLYARGEGVPRSCDQARVLLTAALKRGSTEAGQKLRDLQKSGCSGH